MLWVELDEEDEKTPMNDNTSFHVEEFRVMLVRNAVGEMFGTKVGLGIVGALVYLDDGVEVG